MREFRAYVSDGPKHLVLANPQVQRVLGHTLRSRGEDEVRRIGLAKRLGPEYRPARNWGIMVQSATTYIPLGSLRTDHVAVCFVMQYEK